MSIPCVFSKRKRTPRAVRRRTAPCIVRRLPVYADDYFYLWRHAVRRYVDGAVEGVDMRFPCYIKSALNEFTERLTKAYIRLSRRDGRVGVVCTADEMYIYVHLQCHTAPWRWTGVLERYRGSHMYGRALRAASVAFLVRKAAKSK